jgi:hypothetical protein
MDLTSARHHRACYTLNILVLCFVSITISVAARKTEPILLSFLGFTLIRAIDLVVCFRAPTLNKHLKEFTKK